MLSPPDLFSSIGGAGMIMANTSQNAGKVIAEVQMIQATSGESNPPVP